MGLNGVHLARETDEEAGFRNSPDLVTCMGPNEITAQKRAHADPCAHQPDRGRQTGLFDEVRQLPAPPSPHRRLKSVRHHPSRKCSEAEFSVSLKERVTE
jgi:hypothetical protein